MNKFDNINSSNNRPAIAPSYPEFSSDEHPYINYLIARSFWKKEFDYLNNKTLKFIIDNVCDIQSQWYNIDDMIYEFSRNVVNRVYYNKDYNDLNNFLISYCLLFYNKGRSFIISSYREQVAHGIYNAIKELLFINNDDITLKSMVEASNKEHYAI